MNSRYLQINSRYLQIFENMLKRHSILIEGAFEFHGCLFHDYRRLMILYKTFIEGVLISIRKTIYKFKVCPFDGTAVSGNWKV